jgi:L-rhamnose mutarotase
MARYATFMLVKPGMEEEYVERHRNCWPEIIEGIRKAGIRDYSIFMHGRELFSIFEVDDLDGAMAQVAADPVNQRWQAYMAPLMDVGSGIKDGSTAYLPEVFHVD